MRSSVVDKVDALLLCGERTLTTTTRSRSSKSIKAGGNGAKCTIRELKGKTRSLLSDQKLAQPSSEQERSLEKPTTARQLAPPTSRHLSQRSNSSVASKGVGSKALRFVPAHMSAPFLTKEEPRPRPNRSFAKPLKVPQKTSDAPNTSSARGLPPRLRKLDSRGADVARKSPTNDAVNKSKKGIQLGPERHSPVAKSIIHSKDIGMPHSAASPSDATSVSGSCDTVAMPMSFSVVPIPSEERAAAVFHISDSTLISPDDDEDRDAKRLERWRRQFRKAVVLQSRCERRSLTKGGGGVERFAARLEEYLENTRSIVTREELDEYVSRLIGELEVKAYVLSTSFVTNSLCCTCRCLQSHILQRRASALCDLLDPNEEAVACKAFGSSHCQSKCSNHKHSTRSPLFLPTLTLSQKLSYLAAKHRLRSALMELFLSSLADESVLDPIDGQGAHFSLMSKLYVLTGCCETPPAILLEPEPP